MPKIERFSIRGQDKEYYRIVDVDGRVLQCGISRRSHRPIFYSESLPKVQLALAQYEQFGYAGYDYAKIEHYARKKGAHGRALTHERKAPDAKKLPSRGVTQPDVAFARTAFDSAGIEVPDVKFVVVGMKSALVMK